MKKLPAILGILFTLIIGIVIGVYLNSNFFMSNINTVQISEGKPQTNSINEKEYFDMNLKCQEYLNQYKNNFYEAYLDDEYPRIGKPRGVTLRETQDYGGAGDLFVFYSPITNSCLGTFGIAEGIMENGEHFYRYTYKIDSIFGNEHAWFESEPYPSCYSEFKGSKYEESFNTLCDDLSISDIENIWKKEIEWLKGN